MGGEGLDGRALPMTELDPVVELLSGFESESRSQMEFRDRMLAFAQQHPDALHRTCAVGHFTTSALVVERGTQRFAVLHHRKLRKWLQPGGHVDGASDMPASALREATEETGIDGLSVVLPMVDLDIHRVAPPNEPAHDHLDLRFLVLAPPGSVLSGNHESTEIRWACIGDLEELYADDSLLRLARSGLDLASRIDSSS